MLKLEIVIDGNQLSIETDEPISAAMPIIDLWFSAIGSENLEADHLVVTVGEPEEQL